MNTSANFEQTVSLAVWKQQRTATNNLLCGQINCYSNCQIDYKTNIPLDLRGFFGGSCRKCNHSLWNHHRCRSKWEKVIHMKVSVDQGMKEWEEAKDAKERTAILTTVREKVLRDLNQIISSATSELVQLVERYARLSLSGSFLAQVNSAVRLLELHYTGLGNKSVDQDQLQRVKVSLEHMKRKLTLLNTAKASAREERVEVGYRSSETSSGL